MKIDSLNILLNKTSALNKKFYFISGNEKTLMEKIKTIIKQYTSRRAILTMFSATSVQK